MSIDEVRTRVDQLQDALTHLSTRLDQIEDRILDLEEKAINIDLRVTKTELENITRWFCEGCHIRDLSCKGCPIDNTKRALKNRREALFKRLENLRKEKGGK